MVLRARRGRGVGAQVLVWVDGACICQRCRGSWSGHVLALTTHLPVNLAFSGAEQAGPAQ